jgi:hypothetical protein
VCARKLADLDLRQKPLHVLFAAELGAGRHHGGGRRSDSNPERLLQRVAGRERCNQAADKTVPAPTVLTGSIVIGSARKV